MNFKYITIVIISILFHSISFGQKKMEINGVVKNNKGYVVPFATIGIENSTNGTISDSNGEFTLYIIDTLDIVVLETNCLGYLKNIVSLPSKEFKDSLHILLTDALYSLPEAVVLPKIYNEFTSGYTESVSRRFVKFKIDGRKKSNLGSCIGKEIKVKNNAILDKISFYLKDNDFSIVKFRIKLLDENLNSLFHENIIVTVEDQKTGWITKSLTNKISLPKKLIVAIEWVESSNDGTVLTMPMKIPKFSSKHYYKFGALDVWKKYKHISSSLYINYVVEQN